MGSSNLNYRHQADALIDLDCDIGPSMCSETGCQFGQSIGENRDCLPKGGKPLRTYLRAVNERTGDQLIYGSFFFRANATGKIEVFPVLAQHSSGTLLSA
jgi:hypothetical protein